MDPRLAIVPEGAASRELALEAGRTRVVVAPADQFRLILGEPGAVPPILRALRVGNSLVVTGLPDERELELSNFFGACRTGRDCTLEIGDAVAPVAVTITHETEPIAALSDGSFLLHGSVDGLATLAPVMLPASDPAMPSMWLTGLAGLLGLGAAAGAAGGGSGEPLALLGAGPPAASPPAQATPADPPVPAAPPTPAAPTPPPADTTPPSLEITVAAPAEVTNAATAFVFRFSEQVIGFDATDVRVTGGTAGPLVAAGDGRSFSMTVAPAAGVPSGTLTIEVDPGAATDASGNPNTAASASQRIDTAAPTLTITDGTPAAVTNAATTFTFRFSEEVIGFDAADLRVTGGAAGPLVPSGDGQSFSMTVTPPAGVASGRMTVTVDAGAALDAAGNPNAPADASQSYDTLAPTQRLTLFRVVDNVAPNTGNLVSGMTTNDRTPTLTLSLDSVLGVGDTLTLSRNGTPIRTVSAGARTVTLTDGTLAPGAYAYTALIADAAGNASVLDLNGAAAGTAFSIVVI